MRNAQKFSKLTVPSMIEKCKMRHRTLLQLLFKNETRKTHSFVYH